MYRKPSRLHIKANAVNPRYDRVQFKAMHPSGYALLPALPWRAALEILRYIGNVRAEDGSTVIIADSAPCRQEAVIV